MLLSEWENLSCSAKLINVCKKLPLALDCGKSKYFSRYMIYIFFSFGHSCYGSFPMLFSKAPALYCKKHLSQFFLHCTSIVINSKTVSQVFNILFQTKDINIFVLRCVLFSRYVQLKTSFSDEKNISIEIWHTF